MGRNEVRLVRFDWAMKNILRDKANFDILEGFLTALLGKDIKILNLIESESNQEDSSDKFNRVDLLVVDSDNNHIIIEIQNQREVHYIERILYGTSKLIVENMNIGQPYKDIKKVISVSILYFIFAKEADDYVYYGLTELKGLHTHNPLKLSRKEKNIMREIESKDIFPEYYLIEVEKFQDIVKSDLDEWIYFFKNEAIKDNFKSKHIKKVEKKLNILKMNKEERKRYERYMENLAREIDIIESEREDAREEAIALGKAEGKMEEKIETAKKMKSKGLNIEFIMEMTGLSREEIDNL